MVRCLDLIIETHINGITRRYEKIYTNMVLIEAAMDLQAFAVQKGAWIRGLVTMGFEGARRASAGLA